MKRTFILVIFTILFTGYLSAQHFYTRIGIGGSAGTSNSLDMLYKYTYDGVSQTVRIQPVDLGSGFNGCVAFGFLPSKYVGFELAISKVLGFPNFGDSIVSMPGGTSATAKIKVNVLSVIPSVVITAGLERVNPYARFGLIVGVLPIMYHYFDADQPSVNPPNEINALQTYYGGVALGFNVTGGINFHISKLISMFAELNFIGMNFSPTKSEIIKYNINGVDQLPTMNTKQKETDYVTKLTVGEQIPDTSPNKRLRKTYPLNSVGASFGVMFNF